MIPAVAGLLGMLPSWSKYVALAAAGALVITIPFCAGVRYNAAQCKEAELARQLMTERENMRILEESTQVAEGFRIRAERRVAELEAAARRRANVQWECGDVELPQEVLNEMR